TPTRAPRPAPKIDVNLPPIQVEFRDIAVEAGLTAANVSGAEIKKKYIIETTGGGAAIFGVDKDGRPDIFLESGTTLEGSDKASNHLYRNLGNLKFEDVTAKSGLTHTGWGQGVCVGDYDNDGLRDLFVTYYGHSVLYHNEGKGVFKDVTEQA